MSHRLMNAFIAMLAVFMLQAPANADPVQAPTGILSYTADKPMDEVYPALYQALEENRFFVVFEADMGSRMANFAERWGDDYNRNGIDAIKSMVFCNIWWTNAMANAHPDMLGVCPLHMTLYEKQGKTTVVMPRMTALAGDTPAAGPAKELENELAGIVKKTLGIANR